MRTGTSNCINISFLLLKLLFLLSQVIIGIDDFELMLLNIEILRALLINEIELKKEIGFKPQLVTEIQICKYIIVNFLISFVRYFPFCYILFI